MRFPIHGLRSVEMTAPDLDRAAAFYTGIWGLAEVARRHDSIWLSATGRDAYVLGLSKGAASVTSVTLRAQEATDLPALRARALAAGARAEGGVAAIEEPGGGVGFAVRDPAGRLWRVVKDDTRAEPRESDDSPERLAHVNINCRDIDRDIAFLCEAFGFEMTDRSAKMAFLRTNDDHHALVLADDTVDTLNHVAYNHRDIDSVMRAAGRMRDAGFPIGWGPGRHGPGDNVFVYFVDPFGVVVEHTTQVLQVDDSYRKGGPQDWIWPSGRTDQWGIAPPKTEACRIAQRAIPFL